MDIIIGAGISGLSYAFFKGGNDWGIVEAENEVGGYCRTTKRNGFVWDYSGHFFHFQDAHIREILMERLIAENKVIEVEKATNIKYKKLFVDYPFQTNIHQLDKEEFIDCLVDLFSTGEKEYSNFKEMLYCKFGKSISEKFLIPYNEKLYACDLNILDKNAMGRFFPYAEREQIVLNFRRHENKSYNSSFTYPIDGAIEYIKELVHRLPTEQIKTRCKVVKILSEKKVVVLANGEERHYDRLISTMPFPQLLELTGIDYNRDCYSWNKVLVFNIGFDSKGPITDKHWIYFPERKYCFYRVGFYDNILNQNRTSVYVEIGFGKTDVIKPEAWKERVMADLLKAGLISENQKVVDYEAIIMNPAYVHITDESIVDVKKKKLLLAQNDIYSIGRYGSWTYCSIEDNIKEARTLAESLN